MRVADNEIVLSPSDLMRFQGCEHASALDLRKARGEALTPAEDSADGRLLQKKGDDHEQGYLGRLPKEGLIVVERGNFAEAAAETLAAMEGGAKVIYQGALSTGRFQGWADFIERVEEPSALGSWSYEVVDTKLKRKADPKHALQLAVYSRAVGEMQGRQPMAAHVVIGTGERISFALADVRFYAGRLIERLESFIHAPWETRPEPVAACGLCRWREICAEYFEEADSLVRVAGITRAQRRKLEAGGVPTLGALARFTGAIPRMATETLDRLRIQARLQHARMAGGAPALEIKSVEPGRGFNRLPRPSPGDLFFDMEGDPHVEGGLEYLFGVYHESSGTGEFLSWWAHDAAEEKQAVFSVLEFFVGHLARHPDAFIYHYNHYEVTALKRLTQRYGVGEAFLDHLLRTERFVDLYRVVQQGLYASETGYSLKDLEAFYMEKRGGEVATAGDSILAYEEWRETRVAQILDDIERYNEVDCRSTKKLRDWLASVRPEEAAWLTPRGEIEQAPAEDDQARRDLAALLNPARERLGERVADLLLDLNFFHERADKPAWWSYFDKLGHETEDFIEDLECLGGLTAVGGFKGGEQGYRFPPQETKMRKGAAAVAREIEADVTIVDMDRRKGLLRLKFPRRVETAPRRLDLLPGKPIRNGVLRDAVRRVTLSLAAGQGRYRAISDFLNRRSPRIEGLDEGRPITQGDELAEIISAVSAMSDTCLPIQGPPGTGKTYVSARAILALVRAGKRVAVASNAHKAIDNLLTAVAEAAREAGETLSIVKRQSTGEAPDDPMIEVATSKSSRLIGTADVIGGTAWFFAREEHDQTFDYVFIDEAGQVSIANLLAIGAAARNIVLVGDQMQLPQPVQGCHPGDSGLSTLDYLLADCPTIPPDRGIFLAVSRRMHPDVCRLVSDLVYEGRLTSDAETAYHRIDGADGLPPTGVMFEEIAHEGNSQISPEEADRLVAFYRRLLGASFTDRAGQEREIGVDDILVVSPYNAQVNLLTEKLPSGARVGTVDRFQGQEAPVCLISMATSSGDELPRDVEFLFSLNRLNVALSRAQALAVVFASPRLLDVGCRDLEEMRLVNALCAVRAYARDGTP